jgi:hypothetical protein
MNNKLIHISGITIPIIKSNSFLILMCIVLWLCDSRVSVVNYLCYTPSLPSPIANAKEGVRINIGGLDLMRFPYDGQPYLTSGRYQ